MKPFLNLFFAIFFLSNAFAQIDGAAAHMVEALPKKDIGKDIYNLHCISCHNLEKLDDATFFLSRSKLEKYMEKDLVSKLKGESLNPHIPKFDFLSLYELHKVARYIKTAKE